MTTKNLYYKVAYQFKEYLPQVGVVLTAMGKRITPGVPNGPLVEITNGSLTLFDKAIQNNPSLDDAERVIGAAVIATGHYVSSRGKDKDQDLWTKACNLKVFSMLWESDFPLLNKQRDSLPFLDGKKTNTVFGTEVYSIEDIYNKMLNDADLRKTASTVMKAFHGGFSVQAGGSEEQAVINNAQSLLDSAGGKGTEPTGSGKYEGVKPLGLLRQPVPEVNKTIPFEKWATRLSHPDKKGKPVSDRNRFRRRFINQNLYLPKSRKESKRGKLTVYVDFSGSVTKGQISKIIGNFERAKRYYEEVEFKYFDTKLYDEPRGGGGTNYRCLLFDKPSTYAVITDGHCNSFPTEVHPKALVYWGVYDRATFKPPFGRVDYFQLNS